MLATRSPCALSAGLVVSAAVWKVVALQTAHLFTAVSHRYTHTVCHTHTLTHTHVMCEASLKAPPLSPVCVRVRALSQSQRSEVCVRQREGREALRQPPLDLPAGVFAAAHSWICVIVYCQNLQMFQTRCSVWSLLAGSESVT